MTATAAGQPGHGPRRRRPRRDRGCQRPRRPRRDRRHRRRRPGADQAANAAARIAVLRDRLMTPMPTDRVWGWIGPLIVTAFAAFLRFNRLSAPNAIIFDETYYAKDAWSILQHGVEWNWATFFPNANTQIIAGHTNFVFHCSGTACAEYVVQPPLGKLLIAVGEWLYGLNSLGWRVVPGAVRDAGDPGHVPGRPADHPVDAARLPGRAAAVARRARVRAQPDRHPRHLPDVLRARLVRRPGGRPGRVPGPAGRGGGARAERRGRARRSGSGSGGWRPGCSSASPARASSTRFWYILAFAGLCIAWDIGARRTVGLRAYVRGALVSDGKWLPLTLGVIPLVTYVAHLDRLVRHRRPATTGTTPRPTGSTSRSSGRCTRCSSTTRRCSQFGVGAETPATRTSPSRGTGS